MIATANGNVMTMPEIASNSVGLTDLRPLAAQASLSCFRCFSGVPYCEVNSQAGQRNTR